MGQVLADGTIILDQPHEIKAAQMLARKGALHMEVIGMKRRGRSVYSIIKDEFGFKGNKQKVYDLYCAHLRKIGVLREPK